MSAAMNHRASILHRPLRASTGFNAETAEAQYQREQDFWRAKSQRQQDAHERLNRGLHPSPEDKAALQQEIQTVTARQKLTHAQDNRKQLEVVLERWAQRQEPEVNHEEQVAARRVDAGNVAKDNARTAATKAAARQEGRQLEQSQVRSSLGEHAWFSSKTPASEPPARASRPAAGASPIVTPPFAVAAASATPTATAARASPRPAGTAASPPPPWAWAETGAVVQVSRQRGAGMGQGGTKAVTGEYPWAWST